MINFVKGKRYKYIGKPITLSKKPVTGRTYIYNGREFGSFGFNISGRVIFFSPASVNDYWEETKVIKVKPKISYWK